MGKDKTIIIDGEELEKGDIYIKLQWFTFKESTQTLGRRYVKEDFNEPTIFADYGAIIPWIVGKAMEGKLRRHLTDFRFAPVRDVLAERGFLAGTAEAA